MTERTEPNKEAEASRKREILAYRVIIGTLLFVLVALAIMSRGCTRTRETGFSQSGAPAGAQAGETVQVLDLAERVAEIETTRPEFHDSSQTFFSSAQGTVHMHVLGFEQRVPLHIHPETHEVSVIVTGEPAVLQIYGRDGAVARLEGVYGPGTAIYSPPLCGHAWVNDSTDMMIGNLVFSAPSFVGNLYIEEDDPRLLEGGEPFVYDPDAALERLLAGSESFSLETLPVMDGQLSSLLVRDGALFESGSGPAMAYVTRGEGTLVSGGEVAIWSRQLISIPPSTTVEIEAREGSPLAILVFKPFEGPVASPAFGR
ncbi:MAG: cupin domain-containing protein [Acidobacteriota bacterium]|nr:cupin domain-containing protein [Acidobacteriota bacterium]